LLKAQGYAIGPIDGILGPRTRQAAAEFGRGRGLTSEPGLRGLQEARGRPTTRYSPHHG
jgi:peptidoglycan hydrolase-like protein with peptidoglycan-binding domain